MMCWVCFALQATSCAMRVVSRVRPAAVVAAFLAVFATSGDSRPWTIKTAPAANGDLGYDAVTGRSYAKRSSNSSAAIGGGYDRMPAPCSAPEPRTIMSSRNLKGSRNCYGNGLAEDTISEGSEGSELWDGEDAQEETLGAVDVTLRPLPSAPGRAAASERPPRPPSQPAYVPKEEEEHEEEEDNAQLKVLQRLQERRRLLEETLSPDPASSRAFTFGAAASKSGARFSGAEPAAAVAEAVNRMEALLMGGLSDFEGDSGDEDSDVDDFDGVPVLGGKLQLVQSSLQLEGPVSVSRGGS